MMRWMYLLLIIIVVTLAGCRNTGGLRDGAPVRQQATPFGKVQGQVTGPDGRSPLEGARCELVSETGGMQVTYTDLNGVFEFVDLAPGLRTLTIRYGKLEFSTKLTVHAGRKTWVGQRDRPITLGSGKDSNSVQIAVVYGKFDRVQDLLLQMGIPRQEAPNPGETGWVFYPNPYDLLTKPEEMAQYDIIAINCGPDNGLARQPAVADHLRRFVNDGGVLYASDWAYRYIAAAWPDRLDFVFEDGRERRGPAGFLRADVNGALRESLGQDTIGITFELPQWVAIRKVQTGNATIKPVEVLIEPADPLTWQTLGNTASTITFTPPLMVQFQAGRGTVIFTSFHLESQPTDDMVRVLKRVALGGVE